MAAPSDPKINQPEPMPDELASCKKSHVLGDVSKKEFFDFMRTAYQVYESVEGSLDATNRPDVDWDELEKNSVIKALMENLPSSMDDLVLRRGSEGTSVIDFDGPLARTVSTETDLHPSKGKKGELRRNSLCTVNRKTVMSKKDSKIDPEENFIDSVLKSKLSDILVEGILDSVLPYMVGQTKSAKPTPSAKKTGSDAKKSTTFTGVPNEAEAKPTRAARRKSSMGDRLGKGDGEVEIHVSDEVKGLKKDFKCPQKLLVTKMGYFADVTSGQKLEDMDISVHCDIQIFDWLMRWVKKDSILESDWPQLDPTNVIPILVSASFLQMDPLLHDCLIYCHSNLNDIVKTNTNLACLNDTIITRLGAMYTNAELESIKDRKDKIQSRLFCKMILSLGEPVYETLRGHYASLATLYKCSKCYKLLPRQIGDFIPCVSSSMSIDRRGNTISSHTRDLSWNLSEYITSLHTDLKVWRKVYWRLWGECHFLKCSICYNYFPVHQMEWCCYHAEIPQFFTLEPTRATCLPIGRYPCCGERAYRYQALNNNIQGCQFREHCPEQKSDYDMAVLSIYNDYKEIIVMEPPQLIFPERLTKFVARESGEESGRLVCKEAFWWDGLKLALPRQPLGLLGKLYSGSPGLINQSKKQNDIVTAVKSNVQLSCTNSAPEAELNKDCKQITIQPVPLNNMKEQRNSKDMSSSDSEDIEESESSSGESSHSEESSPPRSPAHRRGRLRRRPRFFGRRRAGIGGRQWAAALSARSNQDQQRQYEERAARQMRTLLARRATAPQSKLAQPLGGVYVQLEADWRENYLTQPTQPQKPNRHFYSSKIIKPNKFTK